MRARANAVFVLALFALLACDGRHDDGFSPRAPRAAVRELTAQRAAVVGNVAGISGDFVIAGGSLRVLVGGRERRRSDRGRVLAVHLAGTGSSDDLDFVAPVVISGDTSHEVVARSFAITRFAGRAALDIRGRVTVAGRSIEVERILTIADTHGTLAILTRVRGARGVPVSIGERVAWGGEPPFVPGTGLLTDEAWHDAEWLGTDGRRRGIAIGFRDGNGRARAKLDAEGERMVLRWTELATALSEGERARALFSFAPAGLAPAVRTLGWARGRPFAEATVTLRGAPPGAKLLVLNAAGQPWLLSQFDAPARVPLPDGRGAKVRATAYGHPASEDVAVEAGHPVTVDLPQSGRVHVSARDDSSGERLPFRARVRGVGRTPRPDLGPIWSAAGAAETAISAGPVLELSMPTGEYEIIVTHGPEWSIERIPVVVTGVSVQEIEARLRREVDAGAWIASDFHLHAEASPDSHVTLADRVIALVAEGVRFAVATDHNHVTDYGPTIRALEESIGPIALGTTAGVEVTTSEPAFGHFNAFPYPLDPTLPANGAPEFLGRTPAQLFADLRAAGPDIIVQVNHPHFDGGIGYFDQTGFDPVTGVGAATYADDYDAIEVWNGYDLRFPERIERNLAEWIAMLARGRRLVATGNSDSHALRADMAGYPRTYVEVEGGLVDVTEEVAIGGTEAPAAPEEITPRITRASDRLLASLREGRAFVTNGPLIDLRVEGSGPGRRVEVARGRASGELRVFAPSWIAVDSVDLYVGDRIAATYPVRARRLRRGDPPGLRFQRRFSFDVDQPTFVIAVVRGEAPMDDMFVRRDVRPFAFTNPIWIDVPPAP